MITKRALPNGSVSVAATADASVKSAVMKLSENIVSIHTQLSELQTACQNIERIVEGLKAKVTALETV
jgi:capsule polysaccharide export protein KpsE/RkpR